MVLSEVNGVFVLFICYDAVGFAYGVLVSIKKAGNLWFCPMLMACLSDLYAMMVLVCPTVNSNIKFITSGCGTKVVCLNLFNGCVCGVNYSYVYDNFMPEP